MKKEAIGWVYLGTKMYICDAYFRMLNQIVTAAYPQNRISLIKSVLISIDVFPETI